MNSTIAGTDPFKTQGWLSVYRPSAGFTDQPPSGIFVIGDVLQVGNNGLQGMEFEIRITSRYGGRADITQLVNMSGQAGNHTITTDGQYWLDKFRFYLTRSFYEEDPPQLFPNVQRSLLFWDGPDITCQGYSTSIADWFQYYVMFRPDKGHATDNIYVPLGMGTWSWSASTIYSGGQWQNPVGGVTRPTAPDGSVVDPPEWPQIYSP